MARRPLSVVAERPGVAVCAGKDCRKRSEFAKLRDELGDACDVAELSCVGLCNGPVVVIDSGGSTPAVYSKLRSKRHRKLIVAIANGDASARRGLSDRLVSKKKVVAKVSRQTKRRTVITTRAA